MEEPLLNVQEEPRHYGLKDNAEVEEGKVLL